MKISVEEIKSKLKQLKKDRCWPNYYCLTSDDIPRILERIHHDNSTIEYELISFFETRKYHNFGYFDDDSNVKHDKYHINYSFTYDNKYML